MLSPRQIHKLFTATFLTFLLSLPCQGLSPPKVSEKSDKLSFIILHTNDIHSHEDAFLENGKKIGGIPRIAHLIKTIKASNPKVLVVDAGDVFQGTAYFETYKGETDIECLSKAGYDIFTPGNHDFDEGPDNLARQLQKARFDVINCNLDLSGVPALKEKVKSSVVKEIDGQKVAFVGVITPALKELVAKLQDVKVKNADSNWLEPVQQEVEKLKAQGIDKIIVVSHCGVELEKSIAAIPGVDLVIGGHSHTRLEQPIFVEQPESNKAMLVQTGCYGRALGRLDLTFDRNGKLVFPDSKYRLINLTEKVFEDPELKSYVLEKGKPFEFLTKTVLAHATANFDGKFRRYECDSPIGDLICDALFEKAFESGATISLQNRGGIRGGIEQGPISLEKVREILPFPNKLVVATVSGKTLLNTLEHSVSREGTGGPFFDLHGIKHAWDPDLAAGKRIVFAMAQNKEGQYETIVEDGLYRLGINDYSFKGGEGYDFKDAKDVIETQSRLSDVLEEYLKKKKTVAPAVPNRFLRVHSGIARLNGSGQDQELEVVYPVPDSPVTVLISDQAGVSFAKKLGVLPLKDPIVWKNLQTNVNGKLLIKTSELLAKENKKNTSSIWLAVLIKGKDENGNSKRLLSAPLKLR